MKRGTAKFSGVNIQVGLRSLGKGLGPYSRGTTKSPNPQYGSLARPGPNSASGVLQKKLDGAMMSQILGNRKLGRLLQLTAGRSIGAADICSM
ncbi:hypothetical protein FRB93_007744 [Tulasnella sp. JGI-2019a]|nr:hypothetical protein FRB93_007744 [Tulasnella sp. JGI-2019a]